MSKIGKLLLAISGILLIYDAYLIVTDKPNPLGYQLPCPVTLGTLGLGLLLTLRNKSCKDCCDDCFEEIEEC